MRKNYIFTLLVVLLFISNYLVSQEPENYRITCDTEESGTGPETRGAGRNDWYNYIPFEGRNIHKKTIRLNFHIFQKSDGTGNYQDIPKHRAHLQRIVDQINNLYSRLCEMSLPSSSAHIVDSKIRFVLEEIYFYQSDTAHNYISGGMARNYTNYIRRNPRINNLNNSIHVSFSENLNDTVKQNQGYASRGGKYDKTHITYIANSYYFYTHSDTTGDNGNGWPTVKIISHEIGHLLGLLHTWCIDDGCEDTPRNHNCWTPDQELTDSSDNWNCADTKSCDPCTNNLMDYSAGTCTFTECQLGMMHYFLTRSDGYGYMLLTDDYDHYREDLHIYDEQEWDYAANINGNLYIHNGGRLTISCMLSLPHDARIIVEPGGTLVIDGGEISGFGKGPWQGITVKGDCGPVAGLENPGTIIMKDCAEIRYARTGIYADYNAVVQIKDSKFFNCPEGIRMEKYSDKKRKQNAKAGINTRSSYIYTSKFLYGDDNDYTSMYGILPELGSHITLINVDGIYLRDNVFRNSYSRVYEHTNQRGIGVNAINSGVFITAVSGEPFLYTCRDTAMKEFKGLSYGVCVRNTTGHTVRIENYEFSQIYDISVYLSNVSSPVILSNRFSSTYNTTKGLYLFNCSNYRVENNRFQFINLGLIVNNSVNYSNTVYRNEFTGVGSALNSYYTNSDETGAEGLFVQCNNFINNRYHIYVKDGYIKQSQGLLSYIPDVPSVSAANQFDSRYLTGRNAFQISGIRNREYKYYYNMPGDVTDITGYTFPEIITTPIMSFFDITKTCPSKVSTGGEINTVGESFSEIARLDGCEGGLTVELDSLTDGGNTNMVLSEVSLARRDNFTAVCNRLLKYSPYLSDTVLVTFMRKDIPGFDISKASVLMANSPLPAGALEELKLMELPAEYKEKIMGMQDGTNPLVIKQEELGNIRFNIGIEENRLIRHCLSADTVTALKDSLFTFLEARKGYRLKLVLVPSLISVKEYTKASSHLRELEKMAYDMTSEKTKEMLDYISLQDMIINACMIEDEKEFIAFVEKNYTFLKGLANIPGNINCAPAQNLLMMAGLEYFEPEIHFPEAEKSTVILLHEPSDDPASKNIDRIEVFPNPASGELWIEYILPETADPVVGIYNTGGHMVLSHRLGNSYGVENINISGLKAGNYILKLGNYTKHISILE